VCKRGDGKVRARNFVCGWLWAVSEKGGQRLPICGLTGFNFDFFISTKLHAYINARSKINADEALSLQVLLPKFQISCRWAKKSKETEQCSEVRVRCHFWSVGTAGRGVLERLWPDRLSNKTFTRLGIWKYGPLGPLLHNRGPGGGLGRPNRGPLATSAM